MKAKALNIKNMKETLVNYCGGDVKEFDKIWDSLHSMVCMGFITRETWNKFFDECGSWAIDGEYLVDADTGEVIFDFNNGRDGNEYRQYIA